MKANFIKKSEPKVTGLSLRGSVNLGLTPVTVESLLAGWFYYVSENLPISMARTKKDLFSFLHDYWFEEDDNATDMWQKLPAYITDQIIYTMSMENASLESLEDWLKLVLALSLQNYNYSSFDKGFPFSQLKKMKKLFLQKDVQEAFVAAYSDLQKQRDEEAVLETKREQLERERRAKAELVTRLASARALLEDNEYQVVPPSNSGPEIDKANA